MTSLDQELRVLREAIGTCGPNARAILVRQAQRLTEGAATYGSDFDDGRDPLFESILELADWGSYIERDTMLHPERYSTLGPAPSRMAVAKSLVWQAYLLHQAELAERSRPVAAE